MQSISISHRHECLNKRDAKSPSSHSMFEAGRMMAEIVIATRSRLPQDRVVIVYAPRDVTITIFSGLLRRHLLQG
jgi:hypothetical protein